MIFDVIFQRIVAVKTFPTVFAIVSMWIDMELDVLQDPIAVLKLFATTCQIASYFVHFAIMLSG